jgi:outer membrane cobalamin receptor
LRHGLLTVLVLLVLGARVAAQQEPLDERDAGRSGEASAPIEEPGVRAPDDDLELPPPAPRVEEEITVSERAAESPTAAVTIRDREAIERSMAVDAAELLRAVSGIHVVSQGSRAGTAHAYTRGGDANFTLVLLDGVPLNDATDVQGGAFNLATLRIDGVESVEVLRGPHSWFFGSSAVAGAINLVTRDGRDGPDGRLRLDAGEHSTLGAGLALSGRIGIGEAAARSDGDRGAGDFFLGLRGDEEAEVVADDSFEQATAHAALGFDLGVSTALRAVARGTRVDAEDYPEGSGGPVLGSGEVRASDSRQLSLGVHLGVTGRSWRHGGSATTHRARADVESPPIVPLVPPSIEERTYTRAQASWIASTQASPALELALGVQVDREEGRNESALLLPPELGGEIPGDYALDRTTAGSFAAATLTRRRFVAEAGIRADDPEGLGVEWSPRAGARWALGDSGWSLRSGWSRAFKLPSFFALASPPALGGNPGLLPETSEGTDLGVELQRRTAAATLTAFSTRYENLVDFDFETFTHLNRSRVDADGVELAARWQPAAAIRVSSQWTFQEVDNAASAAPVLNAPDWFGTVALEGSPRDTVRLRLELRAAAASNDVQIPVPDRDRVDGYEVVDLAASWRPRPQWVLRVRVDNVADAEYEHFVGFPQPGRTARVGLDYDFR